MSTTIGPYDLDTIVTGDVRELAKALPDQCATLAFADPPYWIGFKYSNGVTDTQMEYIDPAWLATELQRVGKVAMITPGVMQMYWYPAPRWVVAWSKPAAMGLNITGGICAWEPILFYGKGKVNTDVLTVPVTKQKEAAFHTCPKPLKLMQQIIEYYTRPGDVVIDFVCGSATTLVAAKMAGRHYLGFEIDAKIAELSRRRLDNTQTPLFVLPVEQASMFAVTA
jgi:DNA modification methylase